MIHRKNNPGLENQLRKVYHEHSSNKGRKRSMLTVLYGKVYYALYMHCRA